jgi:uncharacterized protein YkwD
MRGLSRPRSVTGGVLSIVALAWLLGAGAAAAAEQPAPAEHCPDADLVPASDNLRRVEAATLCAINRERGAARLVPLSRAPRLDRSAAFHSAEMVRYRFLAHESPGRPSLLTRVTGYGYFKDVSNGLYAENVGAGPHSNDTANALVKAWMDSPPHRANILYPRFRHVGIAAVLAPRDPAFFADYPSTVYTTDFGRRFKRPSCMRRKRGSAPDRSATPRWRFCRRRRR